VCLLSKGSRRAADGRFCPVEGTKKKSRTFYGGDRIANYCVKRDDDDDDDDDDGSFSRAARSILATVRMDSASTGIFFYES
jgi:hypothetical protein